MKAKPTSTLPRASCKTLRETQARRTPTAQYPLLAFAHPVYSGDVPPENKDIRALRSQFYRAFSRDQLIELPETAEEAKTVATLLNATEESSPLQLRENASRTNVLDFNERDRLDDYEYLLFAMHGWGWHRFKIIPGHW